LSPKNMVSLGSTSHFLSISGVKKTNWWFQPNPPEKWLSSSDWIIFPTRKGKIKFMFQTTNQTMT
jgi:hypothetical protein